MSDPSSFAETPLAPLRKLIKKWRDDATMAVNEAAFHAQGSLVNAVELREAKVSKEHADELSALLTDLEAALPTWVEDRLRREWWLGHGCPLAALYGDDGEMQCNTATCMRDFKRDPLESLREHVEKRRLAAWGEAAASRPAEPDQAPK